MVFSHDVPEKIRGLSFAAFVIARTHALVTAPALGNATYAATGEGRPLRGVRSSERKRAMTTRESLVSNVGGSKLTAVDSDARLETVGHHNLRYGLVLVLMWIGAMKFTTYEATGIHPLVAHSR